jgi:hypothetical protein
MCACSCSLYTMALRLQSVTVVRPTQQLCQAGQMCCCTLRAGHTQLKVLRHGRVLTQKSFSSSADCLAFHWHLFV